MQSLRGLIKELTNQLGDDIVVLSSKGIGDIIAFRSKVSKSLRILDETEDDRQCHNYKASKNIVHELKAISIGY